jgi:hypothetical protein
MLLFNEWLFTTGHDIINRLVDVSIGFILAFLCPGPLAKYAVTHLLFSNHRQSNNTSRIIHQQVDKGDVVVVIVW